LALLVENAGFHGASQLTNGDFQFFKVALGIPWAFPQKYDFKEFPAGGISHRTDGTIP
jgi:hypothetical protein